MKKAGSFLLVFLFFAVFADAQTWVANQAQTKLGFTVVHLSISQIDGYFKTMDARFTSTNDDFSDAVFELTADVKSLTTGDDTRDAALQKLDMFDTEHFPTLTFKSTSISKTGAKTYDLTGDLTIKSTTKSVTLELVLLGASVDPRSQKQIAGWRATGFIDRTDFGVGSMPAAVVGNDILVRAIGEFVKE